jgi:hypothetical protein
MHSLLMSENNFIKLTLALSSCTTRSLAAGRLGRRLLSRRVTFQRKKQSVQAEALTLEGDDVLGDRSCNFAYCANGISACSLGSGSRMSCTVSPEPCAASHTRVHRRRTAVAPERARSRRCWWRRCWAAGPSRYAKGRRTACGAQRPLSSP